MCEIAGCVGVAEAGLRTLDLLSGGGGQAFVGLTMVDPQEGMSQSVLTNGNGCTWEPFGHERGALVGGSALGVREFGAPTTTAQPLLAVVPGATVAYAHGTILRIKTDRGWCTRDLGLRVLREEGATFGDGAIDILRHFLLQTDPHLPIIERIEAALGCVGGDYCTAFLCGDQVIVACDQDGQRPMWICRRGAGFYFGSDECTLRSVGDLGREILPGEMVILGSDGSSRTLNMGNYGTMSYLPHPYPAVPYRRR